MKFKFDIAIHLHGGEAVSLLQSLTRKVDDIMSKISEFAEKVKAHNDKIDAAVAGVTADIAGLNEKIVALQATQGQITAEDQALLDDIEARGAAIAAKIEALDSLTPPVPPPG